MAGVESHANSDADNAEPDAQQYEDFDREVGHAFDGVGCWMLGNPRIVPRREGLGVFMAHSATTLKHAPEDCTRECTSDTRSFVCGHFVACST